MLLKGIVFLFLVGGAVVITVVTNFGLKVVAQESREQEIHQQFVHTAVFETKELCEKESLKVCTFRDCQPSDSSQVLAVCGKYLLTGWYSVESKD